jgi:peptidoglycan/LPS O-acetylase OafA/YrhL
MAIFFASLISYTIFAKNTVLSSFLQLSGLREIGKISYGIYLYHYPIFSVVDFILVKVGMNRTNVITDIFTIILKIGATYAIAKASWKWFESPILTLKDRFVL